MNIIREIFIKQVAGPVLDRLGSKKVDIKTAGNVDTFKLLDKSSGEVVGDGISAVRDGFIEMKSFTKPTTLRQRLLGGR